MLLTTSQKKATDQYCKYIRTLTNRIVKLFLLSTLICLCIGCGDSTNTTTALGPTPTHSQISPRAKNPTQIPKPTPTLDIGDTSGPTILGGNIGAFIRVFGNPNDHSNPRLGVYNFQTYPGETVDYLINSTDVGDGGAYAHKVNSVLVQASYTDAWSISTGKGNCEIFFPSDAQYKYQVFINNGSPGVTPTAITGFDIVYYSPSLVHEFPPAAFQDAAGNQIQPGLFDAQYLYSNSDGTTINSCSITIGTQGTGTQ